MKKVIRNSVVLLFALGTLISGCGGSGSQTPAAPPAASVSAYRVSSKPVTGLDNYPATLVAVKEVEIRPQVSGYVTRIFIKDGQKVNKGQKLYEIDRSKYLAARNQAEASLASARANLARVEKDLDRYKRLDQKEAIARQVLDNARAEFLAAEAQVKAAEAQVASAGTDLEYTVITAPFAGQVGISQVRVGGQVSPGQPQLNTISSSGPIQVDFVINEREIPRFNRLMNAESSPDSLFTLRLGGETVYPYPGKLVVMDRAVGRQSGTLNVRVEFPNPEGMLVPGMTATLQVLNQDYGKQLVIPYRSVTEQMGEYFVYVIASDSTVSQQTLQLGTVIGPEVVVREGLDSGQTIVVEGIQKLRQGAKVRIQ